VSTQSELPHPKRTDHGEVPRWRGRHEGQLAVGHLALEFARVTKVDGSVLTCPARVARVQRGPLAIVAYEPPATGGTVRCVTEGAS
jgi:hypothetical protein